MAHFLVAWLCLAATGIAPAQGDAVFRGKPVAHWVTQLQDRDIRVRWYAAYALGQIGPPAADAASALVGILEDRGQYEYVRGMAAWALGRLEVADRPVVDMLTEGLRSKYHVSVRRNSAQALGNLGAAAKAEKGTRFNLCEAPSGPFRQIKPGPFFGPVAELVGLLDDEDAAVRVNAAEALWKIDRHGRAIPTLLDILSQPTGPGPYQAADALGRIGPSAESVAAAPAAAALIAAALVDALRHPDADVRRVAARSLGQIGPTAVEPLQRVLSDSDSSVRRGAVEALGRIGRPAVPELIKALGDEHPLVRMTAARALGRLGPKAADSVPALKEAVNDPDREVRKTAAEALKRVSGKAPSHSGE